MNPTISTFFNPHLYDLMKNMKDHKDAVYEQVSSILNDFSTEYLDIFRNGDFYDYLIDIIDEYNIDINKTFNGSSLFHFAIQRRRFDIARKLLDRGAVVRNEEGFITGNGGYNIFTYDPSWLGIYISMEKHQIDVYDFITSYYNTGLMSDLDITTGKLNGEYKMSSNNLVWENDEDYESCREKAINRAKDLFTSIPRSAPGKYDVYAKCRERNTMVEINSLMGLYKFDFGAILVG